MTVVVADSSPLNYLTLIGSVDVLRLLYGRVLIPRQVADELTHQYLVTYSRPQMLIPPEHVTITGKRSELTVRGTPGHGSMPGAGFWGG